MRPFDKKKLFLKNCLGLNNPDSILEKRLAFKAASAETPPEKPADKPKSPVDLFNTDFDNKNFAAEKQAEFKKDLAASVKDIINKVDSLDATQKGKLASEFTRGLSESVAANLPSIAALVETVDPSLATEGRSGSVRPASGNDYMARVLQALKCNKLGLVYDKTDDKLKFKFYGESGEIKFKDSSIKIQYIPESLSAKVVKEVFQESHTFKLEGSAHISQTEFKKKVKLVINKDPVEGDRVVIERYPITLKATYKKLKDSDKKAKFYTEDNQLLYPIGGDKVTYYPNQKDKPDVANEVTVGKETYLVLKQIATTASYLEVAKAIINSGNGQPALLDNKEILDADTVERIKKTSISLPEYAELLMKSHEAISFPTNRLPIVLPNFNTERKAAVQKGKEEDALEVARDAAIKKGKDAAEVAFHGMMTEIQKTIPATKQAEFKALTENYGAKLNAAKNNEDRNSILRDFLADVDDYFSSSGWTRKIARSVEESMDQGKDIKEGSWYRMWSKENPSSQKVMSAIETYSDIFKGYKGNINKVRDTVYDLIRTGNDSQFDSSDIIKYFHIKLPDNLDYDRVLGIAALPDMNSWDLTIDGKNSFEYQKECRRIVAAIETVADALSKLDPRTNQAIGVHQYEKTLDKDQLKTNREKDLIKLMDLLQIDSASSITKFADGSMAVNINKNGKSVMLQLTDHGLGQQISVRDTETQAILWKANDSFGFNAADHVASINQILLGTASNTRAEKAGEEIAVIESRKGSTFRSLRQLETLDEDIPGMPVKDVETKLIHTDLFIKTKELLKALGVYENAKLMDTPENLVNLQEDNQVILNLNYKGKNLSLRIDNTAGGWTVYIAQGYNLIPTQWINDFTWKTLDIKLVKDTLDKHVSVMGSNVSAMTTMPGMERVSVYAEPFNDFNTAIKKHTESGRSTADYTLNSDQFLEVLFSTYSFAELKKMNCVKKISGESKAYAITDLPPLFKSPGSSQPLLNLIYAVKYGSAIGNDINKKWISTAAERMAESKDISSKYTKQLKKIFAYGLSDFDEKGQKATMLDANAEGKMFGESKDEYFKKVNGKAAFNDFYDQIRTRNEKGEEVVDTTKANKRINELYQRGLQRLNLLAKKNPVYLELQKQVNDAAKSKTLNLDREFTDLETKVVRLGYLADVESKEADQGKILENVKTKLIENIMSLLPDQISGPKGEKVNKSQAKASLEQLPVGVLLSLGYDQPNDKWSGGVNIPIILDVFDSKYAKMVLVPGITSDGIQMGVGMAFTNRDPSDKDQIVSFYGGVGISVGDKWSGDAILFAGVSGGVDFRLYPANEERNYNYYMGLYAGLGVDILKGKFSPDAGWKMFEWQIAAQQKYVNEYNKALNKEGLKDYVDELARIYKEGSKTEAIDKFIAKIKGDKALMRKLDIKDGDTAETILANFEIYIAQFTNDFDEKFNLPFITGGEIKIGVVAGAIMASGIISGSPLVLVGGVVTWGVQLLASLNFNVGSKFVHEKHQKTSDLEMQQFGEIEKQKQFDSAFSSLPKEGKAAMYKSGKLTLDAKGDKRAEMVVTTVSTEIGGDQFGKELDKLNATLREKKIDMQLVKTKDNKIEIVLLDSKVTSNDKILISPDIAVVDGQKLFLKKPHDIKFLYIDKQVRKYPLETSHGASIETVTTISGNRFFKGDIFPTDIEINRYADTKETPIFLKRVDGKGEAYVDTSTEFSDVHKYQGRMKKALDKTVGVKAESIRDDLQLLAIGLYYFRNKKGESFVSITNKSAKKNKDNPDYVSTELYAFYDEFCKARGFSDFNGKEKQILTLELSTLRYTELKGLKASAAEKSAVYKERMKWNKKTLIPFFEKRIAEVQAAGKTVTHTAEQLAEKATQDLMKLDTNMLPTKLAKGTSVSVAIGRGADGLHQILDGGDYSNSSYVVDQYGYIMGKDYTEALRTATPGDLDYEIALLLVGQLSNLPETTNVQEFMKSNLAMKLASNGGLAFILGKEQYDQVIDFYNTGTGNSETPGIAKFMEIVKKIRAAEQDGKELITVEGQKGVKFQIKVNIKVQSGIFNKCANYTSTINEEIFIIPPNETEAMALMASGSEARTSLTTKSYKQFLGFFGGVTATVRLGAPPEPDTPGKPPEEPKPDAGSGAKVGVDEPVKGSPGAKAGGASE